MSRQIHFSTTLFSILILALMTTVSSTAQVRKKAPMSKPDTAMTAGDPVPGVDFELEQIPGGNVVASGTTDSQGQFTFTVVGGNYSIRLLAGKAVIQGLNPKRQVVVTVHEYSKGRGGQANKLMEEKIPVAELKKRSASDPRGKIVLSTDAQAKSFNISRSNMRVANPAQITLKVTVQAVAIKDQGIPEEIPKKSVH